jgi:DNA-binding NarL/FixJ family response regulator
MNIASIQLTKAFLVEDSAPILHRLAEMIAALEGVSIVGDADTSASAILGIACSEPDVVVLDIHLREGSGLDVLRESRPVFPATVFIMLTNSPSDQYRRSCMQAGANHFLDKNFEFGRVTEIIAALGKATRSERHHSRSLSVFANPRH